jgi:flagella basal body P-ring formation protein FlgA
MNKNFFYILSFSALVFNPDIVRGSGSLAAVLEPFAWPHLVQAKNELPLPVAMPKVEVETVPPVEPEIFVVDHEALGNALEKALIKHYQLPESHGVSDVLKVLVLEGWNLLHLEGDHWDVEIIEAPQSLRARMILTLGIRTQKSFLKPFRVSLACEYWQEALFPHDRLFHAKQLSRNDFDVRLINTLSYNQPLVPAGADLDLYQLQRNATLNKPLFWSDIERRPDLKKGQKVNAILQDGALRITLKCEVLTPGRVGEFVSLRNLQTRKEFQGKVLDGETVEVNCGS